MKNIFKVLTFLAIGAIALTACDKDPDLPWGSWDDMEYSGDLYVYNLSWEDDTINTVLPAAIPDEWENTLIIENIRGNAQNVDVIVYFNDTESWYGPFDVQTGITSFPAEVYMNADDLVSMITQYDDVFDILPRHQYAFGLRITDQDGQTFVTREVIAGSLRNKLSTNLMNYPGANFGITVRAVDVCPVEMTDFIGTWEVEEFSDRFSAADNFSVEITLDEDGETLIIEGLLAWLLPGSAKLTFDMSNPYAWVPIWDETHLYGITGHPHAIRILNNPDYDAYFASCDMEFSLGYEAGAFHPESGVLLGYWDWGVWTLTKAPETKNMSVESRPRAKRNVNYVESKN